MTTELQTLITQAEQEADRALTICNACRYCEGFCAVFPAMTRRLAFDKADVHYLANLCHNCGACLHACQYAPPHEFGVNIPQTLAQVRVQTYSDYAFPTLLGAAYKRNGLVVTLSLVAALVACLLWLLTTGSASGSGLTRSGLNANFYAIFPHGSLVWVFGVSLGWSLLALSIGVAKFWRTTHSQSASTSLSVSLAPALETVQNLATLKYLDGGHGDGCNEGTDKFTHARRHMHHAVFYGFMLCLASTTVATLYHYAWNWQAPYAYTSLPVILGTLGGVLLLVGTAGMGGLQAKRHAAAQRMSSQFLQHDPAQSGMDTGLVTLLFGTALTGLVLLAARETMHVPWLLAVHMGFVLALFVTIPYGKMAHGAYRAAALLKWQIERRRPSGVSLGE